jgi:hypothetical protein
MALKKNLDRLLVQWPYEPESVKVRVVQGDDGRDVIQMRVDMGILQMEIEGRPDGTRPFGFRSFYDYLLSEELHDDEFELSEEQCAEVDREFVQFYHRRVCWLALRAFDRAVEDADHTLALMDLCLEHSPDDQWVLAQEQYRPFVLFHRTQASALAKLEIQAPESAIEELNRGLDQIRELFVEHDAEEYFEEDGLVVRLGGASRIPADTLSYRSHVGGAFARSRRQGAVRAGGEITRRDGQTPGTPARLLTGANRSISSFTESGGCGGRRNLTRFPFSQDVPGADR